MSALVSFAIYLLFVFVLAAVANRVGKDKGFLKEYFLGSRTIGVWAFALTYAATSASGGSFMGFPSLIYTHGWSLAWWIAGYMVVPLIALGLMAKRINQVSRIAGAITVPELLRRRFGSSLVGNVATLMLIFFMFFYLMAQFKAGAQIMATILEGVPLYTEAVFATEALFDGVPWIGQAEGDYLLCLAFFAVSVIIYTTYGGFRAVVWTDVMQGLVMGVGVIILLVMTLSQVGGLGKATQELSKMTPPEFLDVVVEREDPDVAEEMRIPRGTWILTRDQEVIRLKSAVVVVSGEAASEPVEAIRLTSAGEISRVKESGKLLRGGFAKVSGEVETYAYGAGKPGVYTSTPGPSRDNPMGFLTVFLALSFFVFWNFSGAGQPSYMVRQMAFKNTLTLRRSMAMVAVYFSLIYFPLVIIFTCARVLLPGMEIYPDRVMPEMAQAVTSSAGMPWLAGLLVAAPFAAVMSSVDSFLLLVSSGVVRDIYQESINPKASEKQIKRLTYGVTVVVGVLGMIAVLQPPVFLQHLIVFASAGLGASFLMPMIFALYWRRTSGIAIVAGMVAGAITILSLYLVGMLKTGKFGDYPFLGLHPFIWAVMISGILIVLVSLRSKPPGNSIQEKYFGKAESDGSDPASPKDK